MRLDHKERDRGHKGTRREENTFPTYCYNFDQATLNIPNNFRQELFFF